jgi:hypothetical protein
LRSRWPQRSAPRVSRLRIRIPRRCIVCVVIENTGGGEIIRGGGGH